MELFGENGAARLGVEAGCESGIFEIAQKIASDMELVSGMRPDIVRGLDELREKRADMFGKSLEEAAGVLERPCEEPVHALVLFATVGKSVVADQLERKGLMDLYSVRGKNEVFACFLLQNSEKAENPNGEERADVFAGTDLAGLCRQLLLICGSDKRGTIYGMFHLSELMGVSPLVYWGDAKPVHRSSMTVGK